MIAIPIGPRTQRIAAAASPAYLAARGRPAHPRDVLDHRCIRGRFPSGAMPAFRFERDGEAIEVEPETPLIVGLGGGIDLAIDAALAGCGIIQSFEGLLRSHLDSGALVPVLEDWWLSFTGPFLYYPGRRYLPSPLRAFVEFVKGRQVGEG
jgi:DNA-binding transcriptional LysR family regulator